MSEKRIQVLLLVLAACLCLNAICDAIANSQMRARISALEASSG